MEKIKINNEEYFLDVEKAEELGLLKKDKALPKSWEKFCKNRKIEGNFYISSKSNITIAESVEPEYKTDRDKNLLPDKQTAEAMLALCQLIQLRDCYNDGWKPDWSNEQEYKYAIHYHENRILTDLHTLTHAVLAFKKEGIRNEFLNNFKDLIEIAKPLL